MPSAKMWRELVGQHRRPKWRFLARLVLLLEAARILLCPVAANDGLEVTVALSEKVPKHLCKRALSNLEVSSVTCGI
jgi:hypothetical protein